MLLPAAALPQTRQPGFASRLRGTCSEVPAGAPGPARQRVSPSVSLSVPTGGGGWCHRLLPWVHSSTSELGGLEVVTLVSFRSSVLKDRFTFETVGFSDE